MVGSYYSFVKSFLLADYFSFKGKDSRSEKLPRRFPDMVLKPIGSTPLTYQGGPACRNTQMPRRSVPRISDDDLNLLFGGDKESQRTFFLSRELLFAGVPALR
jgi:hypothetical protein